jgi:cell division septum initiation protein DivIVA
MNEPLGSGRPRDDLGMAIKKDYTIDVLRLLDQLKDQLERVRTFGIFTFGFRRDDIVIQIEKIGASMPRDMRDLANAARERDRMLDEARQEAEAMIAQAQREAEELLVKANNESRRILDEAQIKQERMIEESEVLRIATAQSEEIRSAAEKDSREMRKGAERYAYETLLHLDNVVDKLRVTIERGKAELDDPQPARERVKG